MTNPQDDTDDRFFSLEAEAAVVGSMIVDPSCIEPVLDIVNADDFCLPKNRTIFNALISIHDKFNGDASDAILLRDELNNRKQLEAIGGVEYIAKVMESVPSAANAKHYAQIIREKLKLRKLAESSKKINEIVEKPDGSVGEKVWEIQQIAENLQEAIEPSSGSEPIIIELSDVEPEPIEYLWFNKIPLGMITILVGDMGLGKTFMALDMVARVSTGGQWPDRDGTPDNHAPKGSTVILTAEDSISQTIRPRLDGLGADIDKVRIIKGVKRKNNNGQYEGFFNLQRDLPALQKAVQSCKDCKLVILDPLSAYLGKTDSHKDADVRAVLLPLVALAEKNNVAIVGVMHLNKNTTSKAVYRAMGSVAFLAAARTAWLVSTDPDEPESKRRLFTPTKHNILIDPTGLAFEIASGKVVFEDEPITVTSDEALQTSTVVAVEKEKAVKWLKEILPTGTSLASTEVTELAQKQGISRSTLRRAKLEAGVQSSQIRVKEQNQWFLQID